MEMKRSFTARATDNQETEMLTINKDDLFRLKIEFAEIFAEFFNNAFGELQKTISYKLYAMDLCN